MNHDNSNQGRARPVWFANEEELRRGYADAFICIAGALGLIGLAWAVL